jgi:hypothetical protein
MCAGNIVEVQMRFYFHLKLSVIFVLGRKKIVHILRYPSYERNCS